MSTVVDTAAAEAAIRDAYQRGRQDQADECAHRHLTRVADVLDAIDQHAGDVEMLRRHILVAIGHATP